MLRVLITAGLGLMLVGFGAAGWQYWQGMSKTAPSDAPPQLSLADLSAGAQDWLISPLGGPVPAADVRAYLWQAHAVPERSVDITMTAPLDALMAEGEALPDPAYFEVMADIRAPLLAENLCPVLTETIAAKCAVNSARVVPGSVDALAGTAEFRIVLYYAVDAKASELPDLALHTLSSWQIESRAGGTAEQALRALAGAVKDACAAPEAGLACRALRLTLDHDPGGLSIGRASLAALQPLSEALRVVPEITPAPGG